MEIGTLTQNHEVWWRQSHHHFVSNVKELVVKTPINFDANASYGLNCEVEDFLRLHQDYGLNPSSIHQGGQSARAQIETARQSLAELISLNTQESRVVFTSGATEANTMAILGPPLHGRLEERRSCVTTTIEHPSVLEAFRALEAIGGKVHYVGPRSDGQFYPDDFLKACSDETCFVSVMLANNETGLVLPVSEISRKVRKNFPNVIVHSDAVQGLGKIPFSFSDLEVDMITLSGHKIGGLPGSGALIVPQGLREFPLQFGGPQETRWRPGTENTLGIITFGIAAQSLSRRHDVQVKTMEYFRSYFRDTLCDTYQDVQVLCDDLPRLPNTLCLRVPGMFADDLIVALDCNGVFCSSGAACASGKPLPSHVLLAYGLTEHEAKECIRVSFRSDYCETEFLNGVDVFLKTLGRMRKFYKN